MAAASLDSGLKFPPLCGCGFERHQRVELGVKLEVVGLQRAVFEMLLALVQRAGVLEQLLESWREDLIAGLNDVLGVADEMGKTELLVFQRPAYLGAVAVGNPVVRTVIAEEFLDHVLAARWLQLEYGALSVMKNPQLPVLLADAHRGFVGRHHVAREKVLADQLDLPGESVAARLDHVNQSAFADVQAVEVGKHPDQPLEADAMSVAQVHGVRPEIRSKGRPGRHVFWSLRPERFVAAGADAGLERDLGDDGIDPRNLHVIIRQPVRLLFLGHVVLAMLAKPGGDNEFVRGVRMQGPVRPGMRLALALLLVRLRLRRRLAPLAGRHARVVRRFRRLAKLSPERGVLLHQCRQKLFQLRHLLLKRARAVDLRPEKGVLRSVVKRGYVACENHPSVDTYSEGARNKNSSHRQRSQLTCAEAEAGRGSTKG